MTANRFDSLIATSLLCVLSSGLAALPAAADSFEPLKVTVKFGDLDVSHPQGAAVLSPHPRGGPECVLTI